MIYFKIPILVNKIVSDLHSIATKTEKLKSSLELEFNKDNKKRAEELDSAIRYAGKLAAVIYQRVSTTVLKEDIKPWQI